MFLLNGKPAVRCEASCSRRPPEMQNSVITPLLLPQLPLLADASRFVRGPGAASVAHRRARGQGPASSVEIRTRKILSGRRQR